MKTHRFLLCGAVLLTLGFAAARSDTPAHGPRAEVRGSVTSAVSGLPLEGAVISVSGGVRVQANRSGLYSLSVAAEEIELRASHPGFVSQTRRLTLTADAHGVHFVLVPEGAPELADEPVAESESGRRRLGDALPRSTAEASAAVAPLAGRAWSTPPFNTEAYAHIAENDVQLVRTSPLSTFSIDVDRASYANVRRFIQSGVRPPVDAVRIEEMINYFPYEWSEGSEEHPFHLTAEVAKAPWAPRHLLVRLGLHAPSVDLEDLPPNNLVFLIDVSGSMSSPDKLPLLKRAFALLVEQLRPQDRVAMVVYAGAAGLVLPPTPGNRRGDILEALDRLEAGGSTAGGAGIELAYDVARRGHLEGGNNRVILATDGDFNVGASSDSEMVRLIERKRQGGTSLTVLGFGSGNLKDSKMEQLADHGNGNFHYVDGLLEARKVLVEEMGGTLVTLAKDVKLQVEFNPARAAAYRLIGYENRLLDEEDFNDDRKDAGELGAGHTVTALYEVIPPGVELPRGVPDELRYGEGEAIRATDPAGPDGDELLFVKVRYKSPTGTVSRLVTLPVADEPTAPSADFRFAAAVAAFGMLLRDSDHVGPYGLADVVAAAEGGRGRDERGYRGEFIRLVEAVRDLGMLEGYGDRDGGSGPPRR